MRLAIFHARPHDREFLLAANLGGPHELVFLEPRLDAVTAPLAAGAGGVCVAHNDLVDAEVCRILAEAGVRILALRSAGFNHVDLKAAAQHGLTVCRVPAYSPHAVAELAVALTLVLLRRLHRTFPRIREGNFALEGLLGRNLHERTVGLVGTGKIGTAAAAAYRGFGCTVLAADPVVNDECLALGVRYLPLRELLERSDIISLHCPLMPATRHLINAESVRWLQPGAMLINTSRGALLDTRAVIEALKDGHLGSLGIDVYEEEADLFYRDLSEEVLQDDVFARLLTFPNVVITGHQGAFTQEAQSRIAQVTLANVSAFEAGAVPEENLVDERFLSA